MAGRCGRRPVGRGRGAARGHRGGPAGRCRHSRAGRSRSAWLGGRAARARVPRGLGPVRRQRVVVSESRGVLRRPREPRMGSGRTTRWGSARRCRITGNAGNGQQRRRGNGTAGEPDAEHAGVPAQRGDHGDRQTPPVLAPPAGDVDEHWGCLRRFSRRLHGFWRPSALFLDDDVLGARECTASKRRARASRRYTGRPDLAESGRPAPHRRASICAERGEQSTRPI